jgi:TIR domain-containing protein/uncharacterized protein DUF4062
MCSFWCYAAEGDSTVPETLRRIRIHVSSPSDVKDARNVLANVVEELARDLGRNKGLFLELVRWEESAVPALGRPQELINRQIPAADIFIGILWSRFGTPTGDAKSGTEEELLNALESWRLLGRPHVRIYFCDRPINPSSFDLEQVSRVQKFRKSISEQGLYAIYNDVREFEQLVRQHLTRLIQTLIAPEATAKKPPRLFYSYAREDAGLREELAKHLRVLERNRIIESWYDNMLPPGAEWSDKIAEELEKADIVVLLVSSDFLDSDYCYTVEMRNAAGQA